MSRTGRGAAAMTYNFDPERWFDIEREALARAYREGRLGREAHAAALEDLLQKLEATWDRLDGSFRLPERTEP